LRGGTIVLIKMGEQPLNDLRLVVDEERITEAKFLDI
jgi:hypothetical protein